MNILSAQEVRVKLGGEYLKQYQENIHTLSRERLILRTQISNLDTFYLRERSIYNSKYQNNFNHQYSFSGGVELMWKLNDRIKFESGIGIRNWSFGVESSFLDSWSNIQSVDTLEKYNPIVVSSYSCNFLNAYSDFNPRRGIVYNLTEFQLPVRFNYKFIPKKIDISVGAKVSIPFLYRRYREYVSFHSVGDNDGIRDCYYELEKDTKTHDLSLQSLNFSYGLELNYWLTRKIGLSASVEQTIRNIFINPELQTGLNRGFVFRPLFVGINGKYRLNNPYKSEKEILSENYKSIEELRDAVEEQKAFEQNRSKLKDLLPKLERLYLEGSFSLNSDVQHSALAGDFGVRYQFNHLFSAGISIDQGVIPLGYRNPWFGWGLNWEPASNSPNSPDGILARAIERGKSEVKNDSLEVTNFNALRNTSSLQFSLFLHPTLKKKSNTKLWLGLGFGRYERMAINYQYFHVDGSFSEESPYERLFGELDTRAWGGNIQLGYSFDRLKQMVGFHYVSREGFSNFVQNTSLNSYISLKTTYMLPLKKTEQVPFIKSKELTLTHKRPLLTLGFGMATPFMRSSIGSAKAFGEIKFRLSDQYTFGGRAEAIQRLSGINTKALQVDPIELKHSCAPYESLVSFNRYSDETKGEKINSFQLLLERYLIIGKRTMQFFGE